MPAATPRHPPSSVCLAASSSDKLQLPNPPSLNSNNNTAIWWYTNTHIAWLTTHTNKNQFSWATVLHKAPRGINSPRHLSYDHDHTLCEQLFTRICNCITPHCPKQFISVDPLHLAEVVDVQNCVIIELNWTPCVLSQSNNFEFDSRQDIIRQKYQHVQQTKKTKYQTDKIKPPLIHSLDTITYHSDESRHSW